MVTKYFLLPKRCEERILNLKFLPLFWQKRMKKKLESRFDNDRVEIIVVFHRITDVLAAMHFIYRYILPFFSGDL